MEQLRDHGVSLNSADRDAASSAFSKFKSHAGERGQETGN